MVTLIMGLKGSGKTKHMIELVNAAVDNEPGAVVLIEKGQKLTYDIHHGARLVNASDYDILGYDMLRGLIAGLHAGNYDISHIFIDSLYKVSGVENARETETFCEWLDVFGQTNNIDFTITVSADQATASEKLRRYF
ncbi:MAG: hypothetical protein LBC26_00265 [Oscillospiraceae bacterium]|jgi:hypothetical protein|nr:hypothetical protein [Oscillospiraceae bacterium]